MIMFICTMEEINRSPRLYDYMCVFLGGMLKSQHRRTRRIKNRNRFKSGGSECRERRFESGESRGLMALGLDALVLLSDDANHNPMANHTPKHTWPLSPQPSDLRSDGASDSESARKLS